MLGAIIGDIVGSRFEINNHKSKEFQLFTKECFVTDDSITTLAVAKAIMETIKQEGGKDGEYNKGFHERLRDLTIKYLQELGRKYPNSGFGGMFYNWLFSDNPAPYNSFGNGAAMRISPVAFVTNSKKEVEELADTITAVTHNHKEGIKGARATALAVYMAINGAKKSEIHEEITCNYYSMDFNIDDIRETYTFSQACQETVPQAIKCFLESTSFEDSIRTAISLGGDSDTIAAITGAIAHGYYGVPKSIEEEGLAYLDEELRRIYDQWTVFICSRDDSEISLIHNSKQASIIFFPDHEKLKASIEKLRVELSMLVLERDELLYVECKNIEMAYMLELGGLEYKAYELHCTLLRLKRKVELIQARKNRQEKVIISKIEEILDLEFVQYQKKLEEQIDKMNAAIDRSNMEALSKEESREFKKLYRTIVKVLHPDINPDLSEGKIQLFHKAMEAYEHGDIKGLRIISSMVTHLELPEESKEISTRLAEEKERISKLLQSLKEEISNIKFNYPYTMKPFIQSSEKIEERKEELKERISQVEKSLMVYKAKIEEMLR